MVEEIEITIVSEVQMAIYLTFSKDSHHTIGLYSLSFILDLQKAIVGILLHLFESSKSTVSQFYSLELLLLF